MLIPLGCNQQLYQCNEYAMKHVEHALKQLMPVESLRLCICGCPKEGAPILSDDAYFVVCITVDGYPKKCLIPTTQHRYEDFVRYLFNDLTQAVLSQAAACEFGV